MSSNGKTGDFGSPDAGSIPATAAICLYRWIPAPGLLNQVAKVRFFLGAP